MIKIIKPNFWDKKNFFSFLILPFTLITKLVNIFKKLNAQESFSIKTICIGNIYIGGTGKTSLTIKINKLLKNKFKTVFIKKNYPNQIDEINLLKKKGNLLVENERKKSLIRAINKKNDIALLDDGLQQKNIKYDIKIVCFNSEYGLGNEFLIPAGPLRESLKELKNYDIAFINGEKKNRVLQKKIKSANTGIKIFEGKYKPINLSEFNLNKKYLMFCGIGNPKEFFKTLKKYKFKIEQKVIYPDHYKFKSKDINELKKIATTKKLSLITTEKDYLRLNIRERHNIKFLKVELNIFQENKFKNILLEIL